MEIKLDNYVPRVYQVPVINALEHEGFKKLLIIWGRRCLAGGTNIIMANGSFKLLKDIKIGDKILAWNGRAFETDIVKNKWSTGIKKTIKTRAGKFLPVITSKDHVFSHTYATSTSYQWSPLDEIGKNRVLLNYGGMKLGKRHEPLLAEFLGYLVSDGYISGYQQPKFTNTNSEILDRVSYLACKLFKIKIKKRRKGNGFDLGFSNGTLGGGTFSNPIKDFFRKFGLDVPKRERGFFPFIWDWDKESILKFLMAVISCDGSMYCHKEGFVDSKTNRQIPPGTELTISCGESDVYAWSLYWLLRKLGCVSNTPYKERGSNWKIRLSRFQDIRFLLCDYPVIGKRKRQAEVLLHISKRKRKASIVDGCYRSRFKKEEYNQEELFDLETKNNHNFIANGYVVHNSGKDFTTFNIMFRQAIRKVGTYMYCLPTFKQARLVIWDAICNDGTKFLDIIPKELIKTKNQSEMKITLVNGSIIQLIGSDSFDTSLVGTNPRMVVLSEFALSDPNSLKYVSPILNANDGTLVVNSCVSPNTIVLSKNGPRRIKDISDSREEYTDLNLAVSGLNGFHNAEQYYYGGKQKTIIITLKNGYKIECTSIHPLWDGSGWKKAGDLRIGTRLPIQYGQQVWGNGVDISGFDCDCRKSHNKSVSYFKDRCNNDPDFWYLLGLFHADGNFDRSKICITKKKDQEIIDFLHKQEFRTRRDGIHHDYCSILLFKLLEFLDFKHGARNKTFPEKLLLASKWQMKNFLQGLFDGDGCSHSNRGIVKITSTCLGFVKDLQIILLNFGIVSYFTKEIKQPTLKVNYLSVIYNLEISGYFAKVFYEEIGFRLKRKQKNKDQLRKKAFLGSGNIYDVDRSQLKGYPRFGLRNLQKETRRKLEELNKKQQHPYLDELLKEKFFYSEIKSIEKSENEVFDFIIPETHSFFSNGFISHNTPRGRNELFELYEIAKQNPDVWFCSKLTIDDTKHISKEKIQKDIDSGLISEDMAQQEYYSSFSLGVEGSYYARYIDKMHLEGRICRIAWDSSKLVHTAWDLGLADTTVIIFFQVIGNSIYIIDFYENKDHGLEHYVKYLNSKLYNYGKHIAPHDIRVREWAGGAVTRLQKARDLGVNFVVAPRLSVEDGIEAVRTMLPRTYIDEIKCKQLIKAIEAYHKEYDTKKKTYKDYPLHNWSSNSADAMRYLAICLPKLRTGMTEEDAEKQYQQAVYGSPSNGPDYFNAK